MLIRAKEKCEILTPEKKVDKGKGKIYT